MEKSQNCRTRHGYKHISKCFNRWVEEFHRLYCMSESFTCVWVSTSCLSLSACVLFCCFFLFRGWSHSQELDVTGSPKNKTKAHVHSVILTWVVEPRVQPTCASLPVPVLVLPWAGSRHAACTKTLSSGEVRIRGFKLSLTFHFVYLACYLKCPFEHKNV